MNIEFRSCIEIRNELPQTLPQANWIFFFSPNSVTLVISRFRLDRYKIGAIGSGTARTVKEAGYEVDFVPSDVNTEQGAAEFGRILSKHETVLVPQSNLSKRRLSGIIDSNRLIELRAYSTLPKKEIDKSTAKYLIFTSPSNAEAYLNANEITKDQILVAIGTTTADSIQTLHPKNVIIAREPTEKAIWEAILDFVRKA